jgi:acyl carrier protein
MSFPGCAAHIGVECLNIGARSRATGALRNYRGINMKSLEKRLKAIIADQLGVLESEITPKSLFVDDLNADTLDVIEIVLSIEDKFGIEIPDEEIEKLRTFQDVLEYIENHKQ